MVTGRRAVVLVGNPAAPYSRGLRMARTLAAAGYAVEIAATTAAALPERETGDGWTLRRYPPSGLWARLGRGESRMSGLVGGPNPAAGAASGPHPGAANAPSGPRRMARRATRLGAALRRWIFWPHTVRGWWASLARDLPPADLYHACGSLTVAAALAARDRAPVGPGGGRAVVIYDAIDDVFESNNVLDMPGPIRRYHAARERRWARAADGITTVNESLADRLAGRWGRLPVVVPNYPELHGAPPRTSGETGPLRAALGVGPEVPVVLFQGRLGPRLGLDEAAEAVLAVPEAILAVLGFGRGFDRERARDDEPRFAGRHRTLPARHPDELLAWTRDADVSLIPLPPISLNQRLSSPNKFWESLAAGVPVVVPAELTLMADLVREADLGVVAASPAAPDLTTAISSALERVAADRGWRDRIRATAADRFAWPSAAATYLALVREVAP